MAYEKPLKILKAGREHRIQFTEGVLGGIGEADRATMEHCFKTMNENIDRIIKEKQNG